MSPHSRIDDLLSRWQQAQRQGQSLSPEALCYDCPEVLPLLRERIAALAKIQQLMDTIGQTASTCPTRRDDVGNPDAARNDPLPETIGRYRIIRRLGQGGMGTVYEANDPQLNRRIAIKIPLFTGSSEWQLQAQRRFLREVRAAAAIEHPNVCPIYDVGEQDGKPFVVMAFVEGETLAEWLQRSVLKMRNALGLELLPTTIFSHTLDGLHQAIHSVMHAKSVHDLGDLIVAIEQTSHFHLPIAKAFQLATLDTRIIHPRISQHYRRKLHHGPKTDVHELDGIYMAVSQIRLTSASDLIEAGVHLPKVQRLLGHSAITSTVRYPHFSEPF